MNIKFKFSFKPILTVLMTALLLLTTISITTSIVVGASEIEETEYTADVKNDKWLELEKESSTIEFQFAAKMNPEEVTEYLFSKYDGAAMYSVRANIGQRLQNGGWNIYYNTAAGKQTARTGYNGMYVAASGGAVASAVLAKFTSATGVGIIGGVAALLVGLVAGKFASYSKTCRDSIDKNGNTGTARITLTEARWSSTYDYRW
ncbi:hypothetical protein [Enterococcus mundtii]|uniref:Uncharacterized protein n=1 Tax=Enterococcus mundtii TaxID=53346 RepID=A0A2T5DCN1_ENTMU|nr:hypothetical protein [Enterococcus mundtii]PTO35347.1 hypothetical protein C6N14_08035 [Enterococcus mundtii]